jgi:hypothetical protein
MMGLFLLKNPQAFYLSDLSFPIHVIQQGFNMIYLLPHHLNTPYANHLWFHKSTFYAGNRIFNSIPHSLTSFKN